LPVAFRIAAGRRRVPFDHEAEVADGGTERQRPGGAWYVVYDTRGRQKAVTIYEPRALTVTEDVTYPFVHLRSTGFDHASVVDFVRNNKS